jgi:hypothetical protein
MLMKTTCLFTLALLMSCRIGAQEAAVQTIQPDFQILSESTVQQQDGSTITFRKVAVPVVIKQAQPAEIAASPPLTAAQSVAVNHMSAKETKLLSVSASVKANGFTVLRWTCGASKRLKAVSNVDFRYLEGLANLSTPQADYIFILSAGPDDQVMTDVESQAAQSLPLNGSASFALIRGNDAANNADESALDAMNSLLDYFASHRDELVQKRAQRESDRVARELLVLNPPPQPPKHSVIHFWPLQPAQREAIQAEAQQEAQRKIQGGQQP